MKLKEVFLAPDSRVRATWRAVLFIPVLFALTFLLATAVFTIFGWREVPAGLEWQLLLGGLVAAPSALLAAYALLCLADRRSFLTLGLWFYDGWGRQLGLGLAGGVTMISVVVGGLALCGVVEFRARDLDGLAVAYGLSWNLLLFLPPAAFEELVFRGYPFQRLVEGWGGVAAVSFVSVSFGLVHWHNPAASALSTANTGLIGVLLSLAYLKTRGLWLPLGLHYAWNFWLGFVVSLPVSGVPISHTLFAVTVSGPRWLSGGGYGPEGSALSTAATLAAILWLARTRRLGVSPALAKELE